MLGKHTIYIQYIYISLYLHIYSGMLEDIWKDASPSNFKNHVGSMQNIVGKLSQLLLCQSLYLDSPNSCH